MPAFSCPHCHALSVADNEAAYYWCACGQPLTVAHAVPGMADGVAGEVSKGPAPRLEEERTAEQTAAPLPGDPVEAEAGSEAEPPAEPADSRPAKSTSRA